MLIPKLSTPVLSFGRRLALSTLLVLGLPGASNIIAQEPPSHAVAAERVLLRYSNGFFELLSVNSLRKVLPQSDELPAVQRGLSGFWYELRTGDGSVRYRRIIDNPILIAFEGPKADSADGLPERSEGLRGEQAFSLLLPAVLPGDQLLLFGPPPRPDTAGAPAQELARFDFGPVIN